MIDDLELSETVAHSSMPASYVEFVRQLWRTQAKELKYTFGHWAALAADLFSRLLASEGLGTELGRIYVTPVSPQIPEALTTQAV